VQLIAEQAGRWCGSLHCKLSDSWPSVISSDSCAIDNLSCGPTDTDHRTQTWTQTRCLTIRSLIVVIACSWWRAKITD